jgi:thioester reductase-like protein/amino acid adenylation domain-containing protein
MTNSKKENQTQVDYSKDKCIHHLFENQVEANCNQIAAIFQDQQITYQELNFRANKLANYLHYQGVEAEVLVGICLERSLDTIIGLLGILKAGGAYVPLDPSYPQERLSYMVEDAKLLALLTQKKLMGICTNFITDENIKIICIDGDGDEIDQQSAENPVSQITPQNLAYTIYTSGSTGKPKGVQIEHQSVVNFLTSMSREPGMTATDILLAITTISFDIAGLEMYLPLTVGGCLVIVSREVAANGTKLIRELERSRATVMQATPATWQILLAAGWQGNQQLKVLCGGEALTQKLATQLLNQVGSLWNMYGPTETTIWSTVYQVKSTQEKIAIGQPIANTKIYILPQNLHADIRDKNNVSFSQNICRDVPWNVSTPQNHTFIHQRPEIPYTPVSIGEVGELYIGGDGVARGYLNKPELTAEKFIFDPFSKQKNARLYKTGDLVRLLPDGNIEYIGRTDHQIKIRGFRIETGEIEAVLLQHPTVKEAIVMAREGTNGDKRLVAYLVKSPEAISTNDSHSEQTAQWQKIWNDAYSQSTIEVEADPTFNISGWNNSYTGLPVPAAEIREWVENTVNRILALKPRRLLEIGCGTGLLLFRIAPYCNHYCGTDITQASILYIQEQLTKQQQNWSVSLEQRAADNLAGLETQNFDTVVINSVIQYFPSIDYLVQVIKSLISLLETGGLIFIGDVRSLPLLAAFHTSVQLYQAPESLSITQLRQRIQKRLNQEKGLVIDPAFFIALKHHFPQITDVEIQIKRGHYHNELVRFRYDVVLRVGAEVKPTIPHPWLDWHQEELTLVKIREILATNQPPILGIRRIPNRRIFADVKAQELLAQNDCPQTVGELREVLQQISKDAIDPEDIWKLTPEFPYIININWSGNGSDGCFDVLFKRKGEVFSNYSDQKIENTFLLKPWLAYANNPVQTDSTQQFIPQLRSFLKEKLADYMIPSSFVIMEQLPLTPSGKVDRQKLPAPNDSRPVLESPLVPPQNPLQEKLAEIWMQVLEIEPVGIYDNFFELGGHSLLTAQILNPISEFFGVEVPLLYFFENPTISGLAEVINNIDKSGASHPLKVMDLSAEAVLDDDIYPRENYTDLLIEHAQILLTGSTGFLGAFLLQELLQQTSANIYCLVRANNIQTGKEKIRKNLEHYLLWHEAFNSRIIPILGDLAQPILGLSELQFHQLASEVDVIYHNGALVNLIYPYSALKSTNVLGTQEVLRLASQIKLKPVHYISTLAIFESDAYAGKQDIREDESIEHHQGLNYGYAQSKWVAEKLIKIAQLRGMPVSVYRPGMITGHSTTGLTNTNDIMSRLLKSFILLKNAPQINLLMDMTPVDYVSSAIVYISKQKESLGKTFHLVNPQPLHLSSLIEEINSLGYSIEQIPYQDWQTEILEVVKHLGDNSLSPLLPLVVEKMPGKQLTYLETSSMTSQSFNCQNTLDVLAKTLMICPPINARLLDVYLAYFQQSGFIRDGDI